MKWPRNRSMRRHFFLLAMVSAACVLLLQGLYIWRMARATLDMANTYLQEIARQVDNSVHRVLENAEVTGGYLSSSTIIIRFLESQDDFELIGLKKNVDDMVSTVLKTNTGLYKILIYSANHRNIYYHDISERSGERLVYQAYKEVLEDEAYSGGFLHMYSADTQSAPHQAAYTHTVVSTTLGNSFGDFIGTVAVIIDSQQLDDILRSAVTDAKTSLYLVDEEGVIIACAGEAASIDRDLGEILAKRAVFVNELSGSGWQLICDMDMDYAVGNYRFLVIFSLAIGLLMILSLAALLLLLNRGIILPIHSLFQEIDMISTVEKDWRIRGVYYGSEIGAVATVINKLLDHRSEMAARMLTSQKQLYEAELSKKSSDILALENQINPHFLLNTFQCINGIAVQYKAKQITEIVSSMSRIFKYSLRERDIVTLREELDIARQYLRIIDIRFMQAFTWVFDIPEALLECAIPKMVLQPIIENSIYHGLEIRGKGSISISARQTEDCVSIDIRDTGVGISPQQLEELRLILNDEAKLETASILHKKIGLANICRRIKLTCGSQYGLEIDSVYGEGAEFRIFIPFKSDRNRES